MRFAEIKPNSLVGDWLRRMFPEITAGKMTRIIKAVSRQTIVTFEDLHRVGVSGGGSVVRAEGRS